MKIGNQQQAGNKIGDESRRLPQFSKVAQLLHDLTKKDTKFNWTPECQSTFQDLKVAFTSGPILKNSNTYHPFILECDFSKFTLAA
ncbi:uncharacterized protein VP01_6831g1, partial [Puccinia sorghi]